MTRTTIQRAGLALIVAAYLILVCAYAIRTPAWQAPDEPAHYNYIAQVASNGCCPLIEMGDWNLATIGQMTSSEFAPETLTELDTLQYEDHQPPLYYLIGALIFRLTGGALLPLRLYSAALGLITILLTYAIGSVIYPRRPTIALGAAAFIAFIPQHLHILASVNNDSLAEVVVASALFATILYLRGVRVPAWLLGVIVGIGLITKVNTLLLIGVIPAAIVFKHVVFPVPVNGERARGKIAAVLRDLLLFFIPSLLIAALWALRNISVYGFPDVLGLGAHNLVVADQPRTADLIAQIGFSAYFQRAFETTFTSFWGQFGWMALPLNGWMIACILILIAIILLGWIVSIIPAPRPNNLEVVAAADSKMHRSGGIDRRAIWATLILLVIGAVAQYIYYNLEFWQHQGRYLYPALIPLALFAALGLDAWGRLLAGYDKGSGFRWWAQTPLLLLIPLNLFIVWRVIPSLAYNL